MEHPRDPREGKLPRWAQDLIGNLRVAIALRWPGTPPEVWFETSGDGWKRPAAEALNGTAWRLTGGHGTRYRAEQVWFDAGGVYYTTPDCTGMGGSRRDGEFYRTKRDALHAARWRVAHKAATELADLIDQINETERTEQ